MSTVLQREKRSHRKSTLKGTAWLGVIARK